MKTKFTKEFHKRIGDGEYFYEIIGEYGSNKTVAMLPKNCFVSQKEAEANAKLIAAAPDLFNALNLMLKKYEGIEAKENSHVDIARKAIKKATE